MEALLRDPHMTIDSFFRQSLSIMMSNIRTNIQETLETIGPTPFLVRFDFILDLFETGIREYSLPRNILKKMRRTIPRLLASHNYHEGVSRTFCAIKRMEKLFRHKLCQEHTIVLVWGAVEVRRTTGALPA